MTREQRKEIYLSLCEKRKIKTLFLQPWWLDATGEWDVVLGYRNDQVVGAMPYAPHKQWGISVIGMPRMTHHLSIWMDKPPDISDHKWLTREKQIIWSLIDHLPPYGYFSMVFHQSSFNNWLPFYWKGFRQEVRYTFEIEKTDPATLDQHINRNLKRNLKEAAESITLQRTDNREAFFGLCRNTYDKQKMAMPYSLSLFSKIDDAVISHDAGVKLGAYNRQQELIAVAYLLWDNERAYYFLAGDSEEGRSSGAGFLLCREALRIAFEERNVHVFDFCGSMLEPVTEIRRQFGATAVPLMKIFRARLKVLDWIYTLTR